MGRPQGGLQVLLFFSVARSAHAGQAERAKQAQAQESCPEEIDIEPEEKMPTDKLVDVTPLALRMSSPFNPQYWLSAVNDSDTLATM